MLSLYGILLSSLRCSWSADAFEYPQHIASVTSKLEFPRQWPAHSLNVDGYYAYVLQRDGKRERAWLSIVAVENKTAPVVRSSVDIDLKDADSIAVHSNFAFVSGKVAESDGVASGLAIVDVSFHANPVVMNVSLKESLPGERRRRFRGTWRSMRIAEDHLFVVVEKNASALLTLNVTDPLHPVIVGELILPGKATAGRYEGQRHPLAICEKYAYISKHDGAYGLFLVVDVSNVASPTLISSLYDDNSSGHGGLLSNVSAIQVSGSYAYVASPDALAVVNISAKTNPQIVGIIRHVPIQFGFCGGFSDIIVLSDKVFLTCSHYIMVADVSEKPHPVWIGIFGLQVGTSLTSLRQNGVHLYASAMTRGNTNASATSPMILIYTFASNKGLVKQFVLSSAASTSNADGSPSGSTILAEADTDRTNLFIIGGVSFIVCVVVLAFAVYNKIPQRVCRRCLPQAKLTKQSTLEMLGNIRNAGKGVKHKKNKRPVATE
eukprot:TRINITY_DN31400_c0_g1_i1.p1 TRINITY_DN31400_c0_g1~~TRINITY_DN31400_c0_g1_i1.p1  ORF type:complete len:492 (+),score=26.42 TRINITY_DN31400_c0_g1_i1:49-1524(+)